MARCAIVGERQAMNLLLRYMGLGEQLTHDEKEILMFLLYIESETRGGIAAEAFKKFLAPQKPIPTLAQEMATLRAAHGRMAAVFAGVKAGVSDDELFRLVIAAYPDFSDVEAVEWLKAHDQEIARKCAAIVDCHEEGTWPSVGGNAIRKEFGI